MCIHVLAGISFCFELWVFAQQTTVEMDSSSPEEEDEEQHQQQQSDGDGRESRIQAAISQLR